MPLSLTHPYTLGLELGGPGRYELVARNLGYLPQPSVTEPPWLLKHRKGLIAGRQARKFCFKFDPVFINVCVFGWLFVYIYDKINITR